MVVLGDLIVGLLVKTEYTGARGTVQWLKHVLRMCKALGSIPNTKKQPKYIIFYICLILYFFQVLSQKLHMILKVQKCQHINSEVLFNHSYREHASNVQNSSPMTTSIVLDHFTFIVATKHLKNWVNW
jgi:hypothetical protein